LNEAPHCSNCVVGGLCPWVQASLVNVFDLDFCETICSWAAVGVCAVALKQLAMEGAVIYEAAAEAAFVDMQAAAVADVHS
jgi:hypothetical protein